jgi:hypothetical protein
MSKFNRKADMADFDDEADMLPDDGADIDFDLDDEMIEGGDMWDEDAVFTDLLYLDREGFEYEELTNKAPRLDYPADFGSYLAAEAIFSIFNFAFDEDAPEAMKEDFEAVCDRFVEEVLEPAMEKIGGWGWFDSCAVNLSYDMITGDISLSLADLSRSEVEHDPEALTQFAPATEKKEAVQMDGETDIEVSKADVEEEAEIDNGDGDLAEWIFDAITSALQIAGRGNVDVHAMDQISDKCADICGQDMDKFDALKFHVDNNGNIADFNFNGSPYDIDL